MATDSDILAQLMSRKPAHSLARPFYTDPDYFDADMRHIWFKDWIYACAAAEMPKTGSYVTFQLGHAPVLIVRGADGEIRAFHNTCRHRGSRVCLAEKGTAAKLTCPYHQWTYNLDGTLVYARDMKEGFDASKHGLKPIHCTTVAGIVFICLADEAPDRDAFRAQAERYIEPHDVANLKVALTRTITEKGNWKLVMENNRECYHCAGSHPSLCRVYPEDPSMTGIIEEGDDNSAIAQHLRKMQAANMPGEFYLEPDGQWRFARIPFVGDTCSYTMDGKPAVSRRVGRVPMDDAGSLLFFHYPNSWNHFLADHVILFRILPVTPTESTVTTTWLVHKDAEEGKDYDLARLVAVWDETNDEDRRIVEDNQRGIMSPAYEPGPYSEVQESGVIQFIDWYADTLTRRLTGRRPTAVAAE